MLVSCLLFVISDRRMNDVPNFIRRATWVEIKRRLGLRLRFFMLADNAARVPTAEELPQFGNRLVRNVIVDLNHMRFLKGQSDVTEANRGDPVLRVFEKGCWSYLQIKQLFDNIENRYPRLKKAALIRQIGVDPALCLAQQKVKKYNFTKFLNNYYLF